jgi:uncharacterized protein YbjT (DUF2867 family)
MLARYENQPQRLTIVAEAGGVGGQLLEQALVAGHRVTAVVRDPAALSRHLSAIAAARSRRPPVPAAPVGGGAGHVVVVNDDAPDFSLPAVCVAVTDVAAPDAELLELATEGADAVLSAFGIGIAERATRAIVQAMRVAGAHRLVALSPGLVGDPAPGGERGGEKYGDLEAMQDVLRVSDLDWTIVGLPELPDGPSRRQHGASHVDVARFMLRALEEPQAVRQTIGGPH